MVKKSENIVLDMKVGRLAKGSQAAKDFMKELREKKGKGKVSGKGNKGSRPSAAEMADSKKNLLGAFHAEEEKTPPSTPVGSPVQSVPAPPARPARKKRRGNTGGQPTQDPLAQPSTPPNQPVSTSAGVPAPSSLPTGMLVVDQPATIGEAVSTLENAANTTTGRGLLDAKKRAHKFILDNIDKVKEADLDRIKKVFLSIKGKGIFDSIGKAFKKAGKAVAKTATSVGKKVSRGATKVAKTVASKTEDAAFKTGDFVKSEKGLKTIGKYAVPAAVGLLAGVATGGNPVASAAAGAATGAAYDKLVMGKGGLIAQEAFGEGLTGGMIEGEQKFRRHPIKRLSAKQMTSMRKGRGVRCIRAPCPDDSMDIMVDPMNMKKLSKSFMKGKGTTIKLSPEELNCNKCEMKGEGIFGRWGDKVMDKLGVKKIAYKVGDIAKPFIKSAISKAAIAIPTALGQPELIPAAMIAANVVGKYMDKPSDYQKPAEKALNIIQGKKSIMDVAKAELPALAKSTLNDYIQRYGSAVLEGAVQAAKENLGLVRPNDNSPLNYGSVAGNGIYGRGLTAGRGLGGGLTAGRGLGGGLTAGSGAFAGQGIYAGSNRVIGGQVGQHSKGIVALDHPSLKSRPELVDISRLANQYYKK